MGCIGSISEKKGLDKKPKASPQPKNNNVGDSQNKKKLSENKTPSKKPSKKMTMNQKTEKNYDFSQMRKVQALYEYKRMGKDGINLAQGQIVYVIDDTDARWWTVINPDTKDQGIAPCSFLGSPKDDPHDLTRLEFYFADIERGECEQKLLSFELPGAFMIRPSNHPDAPFTLSLLDSNRAIRHYRINLGKGNKYFIGTSHKFADLVQLVEYYKSGKDNKIDKLTKSVPKSAPDIGGLGKDVWEVDRDCIQLLSRLGAGFYGEVWKGIYQDQSIVAVKTFKEGKMDPQDFLNEANIMKKISHRRLVKLLAVCTTGTPLYIVCEFMDNGCLKDYLMTKKDLLNVGILVSMCCQICEGMQYLESINIVHRDLAARNVLINKNCECKIADFGMALLQKTEEQIGNVNTHFPVRWTAPEAIEKRQFSNKSDIWSFGVCMWEILSYCETPYSGMQNKDVLNYVKQEKCLSQPDNCTPDLYNQMKNCWKKNPNDRPSFRQLYPYLQQEEKLAANKGGLYSEL